MSKTFDEPILEDDKPVYRNIPKFAELKEVLHKFTTLPEGDSFHVDDGTAMEAVRWLDLIATFDGSPPPEMFPHGEDAVVLKWYLGPIERFITLADGEVGILDIHSTTREKERSASEIEGSEDRIQILQQLGMNSSSRTNY